MTDVYRLKFEDGIIGKLEEYWKIFPIKPIWLRAQGVVFTSSAISKVELNDRLGPIKGNIFVWNLTDSGGYKSPILRALRRLFVTYNKSFLLPARFTIEGLTEQCTGRHGKEGLEDIVGTPVGVILRDEVSRLIIEKGQKQYGNLFAFLCELWDGWLEGYRTRTFGSEGGIEVYISMCAASNEHFLKKMDDDDFWIIGLGARIELLDDIEIPFKKYDLSFFEDAEDTIKNRENEVYNEVIVLMKQLINENIIKALIKPNAANRWIEYEYKVRQEKEIETDKIRKAQLAKKAQHVLKLAMNYAASRLNIYSNILFIDLEDLERAIADAEEFFNATMRLVRRWRNIQTQKFTNPPSRIDAATKHKQDYMSWVVKKFVDGIFCATDVQVEFEASNLTKVTEVLVLCVKSKLLEIIANQNEQGSLTNEQYKRFIPKAGFSPRVYKVTEEGRKYVKSLGEVSHL